MSEGGAGMEVSRMTCLHFECYHQPQKEKLALSLNRRNHSPAPSPSLGRPLTVTGVVGALQINWRLVLGSDGKRAPFHILTSIISYEKGPTPPLPKKNKIK